MIVQRWLQRNNRLITWTTGSLILLAWASLYGLNNRLGYAWSMALASIIAVTPIAMHAFQALKVKVVSIELLVTIAVIGAFVIGEFNESAIVTFLFLFGALLEQKTLAKTRQSIKSLTEMAPTTAAVLQEDGTTEAVDIDDVEVGEVIVVKTGASIPVDGVVVNGTGYTNEAAITGESREITKVAGQSVFAGSLLSDGYLEIRAKKVGDDSTFAKIIELVEDAQDTKSAAEKFIDRFAKYYTPAVLLIAIGVFAMTQNFRLAITVLVLGCPGALVIGAPVSNVAGIGNGAKRGILVKGGQVMDTFAQTETFVFDKTGTLTEGQTAVTTVKTYGDVTANQLIGQVAALEKQSDHPLGRAIVTYATDHGLVIPNDVHDSHTIKGQGMTGKIDDDAMQVGDQRLMMSSGLTLTDEMSANLTQLQAQGGSVMIVAVNEQILAIIGIADVIRPGMRAELAALKQTGAKRLVMLTGDNQATAEYVANQVGIDELHADLLPDQKVAYLKQFQTGGDKVTFVGDGINDSPSIATADIGIAIGGGTDVAIETSDIVLMRADFGDLVHAYRLAKRTRLNTRENIWIAISVVALLLAGLIAGMVDMASGMFVHEFSILVVILNAMRLINFGSVSQKLVPNLTQINQVSDQTN